jgi:hypothetical protein
MNRRYPFRFLLTAFWVSLLVLGACNYPGMRQDDLSAPDATWTAIAQTIAVQLTQSAGTFVPGTGAATPAPGGGSPEITPSPDGSDAPAPTSGTNAAPPAPSPTLSADDPRQRLGSPEWLDPFDSDTHWEIYTDDHVSLSVENGVLRMISLQAEVWYSWTLSWPRIEDFYLEAVMTPQTACTAGDHYGILVRSPSATEGYLFGLSCDGRYSFREWDGQRMRSIISWTSSEHILTGAGQPNRLGVLAQGERIQLFVNGSLLAEVADATYTEGAFGPFIGSVDTANFTVEVDEIGYWNLP